MSSVSFEGSRALGEGRYVLERLISQGGTGRVWYGRDSSLDRPVAVKELWVPPTTPGPQRRDMVERMRREARSAARLRTPGAVTIHDVLVEDDRPWIVMEYVEGESLQLMLSREHTLPVWQVGEIGAAVLTALSEAHRMGIVHRDVKPSNILVRDSGEAALTDFGIAQAEEDPTLTAEGLLVGSVSYLAPELLSGKSASPDSDLWALGVTLFEALEGRTPFAQTYDGATLAAISQAPLPPSRRAGPLRELLEGLLEKRRRNRMSADDAMALLNAAAALRPDRPRPPRTVGWYQSGRLLGAGHSGSVWLGRVPGTDDTVAIKLVDDPDAGERMSVTAAALAELASPLLPAIIDIGLPEDNRVTVVMERALGTLARRIPDGPLPSLEALDIAAAAAAGLALLHRMGTAHGSFGLDDILVMGDRQLSGVTRTALTLPDATTADTPAADVRSLAAITCLLLNGVRPAAGREFDDVRAWLRVNAPDAEKDLADPGSDAPSADRFAAAMSAARYVIGGAPASAEGDAENAPTAVQSGLPPTEYVDPWTTGVPSLSWAGDPAGPTHLGPSPAPTESTWPPYGTPHPWQTQPGRAYPPPRQMPGWILRPYFWLWQHTPRLRLPGLLRRPPPPDPWHTHVIELPQWLPPLPSADGEARIRLSRTFRYVHEPLPLDDRALPVLGSERLRRSLQDRLAHSKGGTFLITGFRGVGKTTLVEWALEVLAKHHPRGRTVLPVVLSAARPMTTEGLLFAMVRRIFDELSRRRILDRLPAETRQSLLLAYMRTSLSFKQTRSEAAERAFGIDVDPSKFAHGAALLLPKASLSSKRSRSLATEAAFLAYSETDVEHDMMRIVRLLSAPLPPTGRWWRKRPGLDLQLVIVLDEVDKLTGTPGGLAAAERLLSSVKNVVTMCGAHYLVVAGLDLHDQVVHDTGRGNSVYESIFAWRLYMPCNWDAPRTLLAALTLGRPDEGGLVAEFEDYLRYRSRGIVRRMLHELNSFVFWEHDTPYLRIGGDTRDAVGFYAELERTLQGFFRATAGTVAPTALDQDRWRLGGYVVVDWILRSDGRAFGSADVMNAVTTEELDPMLRLNRPGVELLLEYLARSGVVDVVRSRAQPTSTVVSDVTEAQWTSYRLAQSYRNRLLRIAVRHEYERADAAVYPMTGTDTPIHVIDDRYELLWPIGEGGTGTVYHGRDRLERRPVAVKVLRSALADDLIARKRFRREALIAQSVRHPNVVRVYGIARLGDADDPDLAIVMELLAGRTLGDSLDDGAMSPDDVAALGLSLAETLAHLGELGLARFDIKPQNIFLDPVRGPVLIDLGIVRVVDNAAAWPVEPDSGAAGQESLTRVGIMVGTPAYCSPEQAQGQEVDIRSDIFSLGMMLVTCLAGKHPFSGQSAAGMIGSIVGTDVDTSLLPGSPGLRAALTRATARDLAARYQRPADLAADLRDTPEAEPRKRS